MDPEGIEQQIFLQPEMAIVGAVYSVNGYTGHVVLKTSDLENDSGYQTEVDVNNAIELHNDDEEAHQYIQGLIGTKQDILTAGTNIQISEQNVISATDTTYSAGNGINISGQNAISIDTTVVATQQNLADEVTNRENADIALQQQIDGISASSDVVDIVGTYAELQAYDTQHLKDNDIIKVLQDETQGGATTYYRWNIHTQVFTLIGQEGPYYTKASADAQFVPQTRTINSKALSSNITLTASDVNALGTSDIVQTTGSNTAQVMSQKATTDALATKLNITDYVVDTQLANSTNPVQNKVLYNLLKDMPSDFFTGEATSEYDGTILYLTNPIRVDEAILKGDTTQQTYSGKNLTPKPTNGTNTSGGVTFTTTSDTISGSGTLTATPPNITKDTDLDSTFSAGTYTFSIPQANIYSVGIALREPGGTWHATAQMRITIGQTSVTFTTNYSFNKYRLFLGGLSANTYIDFSMENKFQFEAGSTATDWEPYVGGIPSPNTDFPQDINVVTGTQTVKVHSKNFFNKNGTYGIGNGNPIVTPIDTGIRMTYDTSGTYLYAFWVLDEAKYFENKTLTLSADITKSASGLNPTIMIGLCDSTGNYRTTKKYVTASGKQSISYAVEQDINKPYIYVALYVTNGGTFETGDYSEYANVQLEIGETATNYKEYTVDTYTIDLNTIELCKIGTYQDYIYKNGDDWYIHNNNGKTTDSIGSSNITISGMKNNGDFYSYCGGSLNGTTITYSSALSVSNNIYYQLASATDTQITDNTLIGQLNALATAKCYDDMTLISSNGMPLPVILDLTAINANANGIIYKLRSN